MSEMKKQMKTGCFIKFRKISFAILFLLLFFMVSNCYGQSSQDAQLHFRQGKRFWVQGKFDEAILEYSKAIEIDPNFVDAYKLRGNTYLDKGDYDHAISNYNQAIQVNPKYANLYYNRGIAYRRKGDLEQAIADCTQAIKISPNYAMAYNNRGVAYAAKGDYDKAISDYNKAIKINPNFVTAYYNRGLVYYYKGNYKRAISDFTSTIKSNPYNANAYSWREDAYAKKGDYDKATSDYEKAALLFKLMLSFEKPDLPEVLNGLAWVYSQLNTNLKEAVTLSEKAYKLQPNRRETVDTVAVAHWQLAKYYFKNFKWIGATKAFITSLKYKWKLQRNKETMGSGTETRNILTGKTKKI